MPGTILVVGAVPAELAPYESVAKERADLGTEGFATGDTVELGRGQSLRRVTLEGHDVALLTSGIGLVAAATAAAHALQVLGGPEQVRAIISTGSAGGLNGVKLGDSAVGTSYGYTVADATLFGYEPGQVPGQPVLFDADPELLGTVQRMTAGASGGIVPPHLGGSPVPMVVCGPMVSGDTFVGGPLLDQVLARRPDAIATDMESTALAQVAHTYAVPFLSVRGISDLCGPAADDDYRAGAVDAAGEACDTVLRLLATLRDEAAGEAPWQGGQPPQEQSLT